MGASVGINKCQHVRYLIGRIEHALRREHEIVDLLPAIARMSRNDQPRWNLGVLAHERADDRHRRVAIGFDDEAQRVLWISLAEKSAKILSQVTFNSLA